MRLWMVLHPGGVRKPYGGPGAAELLCEDGHRGSWVVIRRLGTRWDLLCHAAAVPDSFRPCLLAATLGGKNLGFCGSGPKAGWLDTKLSVLSSFGPGNAYTTLSLLRRRLPNLTVGQIAGALSRATSGKSPSVVRSAFRLPTVPSGAAFGYQLTARGRAAVAWGVDAGRVTPDAAADALIEGPALEPVKAAGPGRPRTPGPVY